MSHYTYLGAAVSAPSFILTPTKEGDGFSSLFEAYAAAFPPGSPEATNKTAFAKAVCAANGVPYRSRDIDAWVFALSGKRFPYNPKDNPAMYGGVPTVGWAYFGEGNMIKLPNFPRPGLPGASSADGKAASQSAGSGEDSWWTSPWVIGGVTVAALIAVAAFGQKKEKSLPSVPVTRWTA